MPPVPTALLRALGAYHHRAIHLPRTERVAAALVSLIGEHGGASSLLDVGCGDGRIAAQLGRAMGLERVVGLDEALRAEVAIEAFEHRGATLPFASDAFDVVLLSDVLHHAQEPAALLAECLRVAKRGVALKDHLAFGRLSRTLLLSMDLVGNAAAGVPVRGHYLEPSQWFALVEQSGGHLVAIHWPLRVHSQPWRWLTRSGLQFAAWLEPHARRVTDAAHADAHEP